MNNINLNMKTTVVFKKITNIEEDISKCLELLKIKIKPKKVLIKPNLLEGGKPGTAVCTNVNVLKALVNLLQGMDKEVIVADGSVVMDSKAEAKIAGYGKLEIPFKDLNADNYVVAEIKDALEWTDIEIAKTFYDAEYIINVPTAKCHHLAGVSIGIKNLMGVLRPIGNPRHGVKAHIHQEWDDKSLPEKEAKEKFERRLVDLLRAKKIDLTLVDGSYGLQEYESSDSPIKTDFLIASTDILSADIVCSKVMGFKPEDIYLFNVAQRILGERDIKVIGDELKYFDFKKSSTWLRLK